MSQPIEDYFYTEENLAWLKTISIGDCIYMTKNPPFGIKGIVASINPPYIGIEVVDASANTPYMLSIDSEKGYVLGRPDLPFSVPAGHEWANQIELFITAKNLIKTVDLKCIDEYILFRLCDSVASSIVANSKSPPISVKAASLWISQRLVLKD